MTGLVAAVVIGSALGAWGKISSEEGDPHCTFWTFRSRAAATTRARSLPAMVGRPVDGQRLAVATGIAATAAGAAVLARVERKVQAVAGRDPCGDSLGDGPHCRSEPGQILANLLHADHESGGEDSGGL